MYACIACSLLSIVLVGVLTIDFYYQNRKADTEGKLLESHDVSRAAQTQYLVMLGFANLPVGRERSTFIPLYLLRVET